MLSTNAGRADVDELTALTAEASNNHQGAHFKAYVGLTARASQTGETDRKGQPMSKAGSTLLYSTLIRAADHARKQDPQLARIYYVVERGAEHINALCVVAAHLAECGWAVLNRRMPYVICDTDGPPVTPAEAKKTIAGTRARRSSGRGGGQRYMQSAEGATFHGGR